MDTENQAQWLLDVGHRVGARREELRMTQQELSVKADLSIATVRQLEQGTKPSNIMTLTRVAAALEISTDEILWGDERPSASFEAVLEL